VDRRMNSPIPTATLDRPRIAVTLGDPRGIGPEIVASVLADPALTDTAEIVVVGPDAMVGTAGHGVGGWTAGASTREAGWLAGKAVAAATELALAGEVDAIVTAPIDKSAFREGGWDHPGHTEMLRDLAGVPAVAMMMAAERTSIGPPLRVVLATTHLALREVTRAITTELIAQQARLTHAALRDWWDLERPRIALCAVNPHASDNGLFGDEEARVLEPARRLLGAEGIRVSAPIPADTVFLRALRGEFDAVLAPYHDVGMAAFKTAAFGSGVNVTLGLPFPRTSPDHGTALDIAGKGVADASSMKEAVRLAVRLANRKRIRT
ncbi:MAG TPA: 4-hydroxythreonine-4-phosphate dehydrogenase PdxA, partial [Longimicrobiaceae bacterium]|nr:4-hydroxythreonine-4-phosphate dehydrogenase PdxA [Longimicrobiaceae bacterium]